MPYTTIERQINDARLGEILVKAAESIINTQLKINEANLDIVKQISLDSEVNQSIYQSDAGPSFYKLDNTSIDLNLALSMGRSLENNSLSINAATINPDYCNEFQFDPNAANCVRANLVPITTPDNFRVELDQAIKNAELESILGYVLQQDASSLTIKQLKLAGLQNIIDEALSDYKEAISNADPDLLKDFESLQALIDKVNLWRKLIGYNLAENADSLTIEELKTGGLKNVVDKNLGKYKTEIAAPDSFTDFTSLQALIDRSNLEVIKNKEETYIGKDARELSIEQLNGAGLENITDANIDAYRLAIAALGSIDSKETLQALINEVNLGVIRECSLKGDTSDITIEHIKALSVKKLVDNNFEEYKRILREALTLNLSTLKSPVKEAASVYRKVIKEADPIFFEKVGTSPLEPPDSLQEIIDAVNISVIRNYDSIEKAGAMTIEELEAMGIEKQTLATANLEAYQKGTAVYAGKFISLDELQTLINRQNALVKIRNYRFIGKARELSIQEIEAAGVENTQAQKLGDYREAIARSSAGFPQDRSVLQNLIYRINNRGPIESVGALQAVIDRENILSNIRDYCLQSDATHLTPDELKATGVENFVQNNFEQYQQSISTTDSVSNFTALQALIDYINAITDGSVTALNLERLGIQNAIESNIQEYKNAGLLADLFGLQELIDKANLDVIKNFNTSQDASALTLEQLKATEVNNIADDSLEKYKAAIVESDPIEDSYVLQQLIDKVNSLEAIKNYNEDGNADRLSLIQLEATQAENIEQNNFIAYKKAIGNAVSLNDIKALQALIDQVNG